MRRSMKEGRAAAAPARKATGAKSAHWRIPHPPMAAGRDMRSFAMPVVGGGCVGGVGLVLHAKTDDLALPTFGATSSDIQG
jgi:hypothetical protein